ncbi:MAG: hypothetical protein ABOK23_11950 [Candidatus Methanoperedens sp.]|nr:hypothetical protein [Candidatus Methanoperedens sp.]MCZ7395259.1 hypothetical protein [Candidatus Methanoperedens sp.]
MSGKILLGTNIMVVDFLNLSRIVIGAKKEDFCFSNYIFRLFGADSMRAAVGAC